MEKRGGSGHIRITQVDIEDESGKRNVPFFAGSKLRFLISYHGKSEVHNPRLIIGLLDLMTTKVARFDTEVAGYVPSLLPASGQISCSTEAINLVAGRYYLNIAFLSNGEMQDYLQRQSFFDIVESNFFGTGKTFDEKEAKVLIKHEWKTLP